MFNNEVLKVIIVNNNHTFGRNCNMIFQIIILIMSSENKQTFILAKNLKIVPVPDPDRNACSGDRYSGIHANESRGNV